MNEFLKETFRPPTEEERRAISRYHRQRAVVGVISMLVMLFVMALILFPMASTRAKLGGTWIAIDEHADGFQPEDDVLEFKDGVFYRNGKNYGMPVQQDGKVVIHVHAPAGSYDRIVTANGDTLTMEYELPNSSYLVGTGSSYAGFTGSIDPLSTAFVQSVVAQQQSEDRHVVETYVRISNECDLTEAQRDALY